MGDYRVRTGPFTGHTYIGGGFEPGNEPIVLDEAVEAAARALHAEQSHFDGKCDIPEHWTAWVDAARCALTAAAPLILAERDEQLRGLVETWREWAHVANATAAHTFTECANHLAALPDGDSDE